MAAIDEKQAKRVAAQTEWLAGRFRELREAAGFTQKQVGEVLGVNHRRMWEIESGKFDIKVTTLFRLAFALGVPIDKLMEGCPRSYSKAIPPAAKGDELGFIIRMIEGASLDVDQYKEIEKIAKAKRLALG